MIVPNIYEFSNCQDYIKSMLLLNEKRKSAYSYRVFSKRLGWSASYLNEVVNGKRKLSLKRAYAFSKLIELDVLETQRFIWLVLQDSTNGDLNLFIKSLVNDHYRTHDLSREREVKSDVKNPFFFESNTSADFMCTLLFGFLRWKNGKTSFKEICNLLYTCHDLHDFSRVQETLEKLRADGLIEVVSCSENGKIVVKFLKHYIFINYDKDSMPKMASYTDNMARALRSPRVKGTFTAGIIKIKKNRFKHVQKKLIMFRNFLTTLESEAALLKPEECFLFQYENDFACIVDIAKLGESLKA